MYFKSLQVLRGWAALAVVLYHVGYYVDAVGKNPNSLFRHFDARFSYGAWFFFVLSGFLMSHLIDTGYRYFLLRRLLRIFPSFWLAVIAVVFGKTLIFGSIETPGLWKAMLLAPFGTSVTYPLGVEWTLIYEVFFYLVCAIFANNLLRHAFPYFLAIWLGTLLVAHLAFDTESRWFTGGQLLLPTANHIPLSMMNELFIAGGLSYYVYRRLPRLRFAYVVMLMLAAIVFILADHRLARDVLQIPNQYATYADYTLPRLCLMGLSFALVVVAVCIRERDGAGGGRGGVLEKSGDYSYALYLIHVPAITVTLYLAHWKLQRPVGDWICAAALAAALLAGWSFGRLDVWLHNRFRQMFGVKGRMDELPSPSTAAV